MFLGPQIIFTAKIVWLQSLRRKKAGKQNSQLRNAALGFCFTDLP